MLRSYRRGMASQNTFSLTSSWTLAPEVASHRTSGSLLLTTSLWTVPGLYSTPLHFNCHATIPLPLDVLWRGPTTRHWLQRDRYCPWYWRSEEVHQGSCGRTITIPCPVHYIVWVFLICIVHSSLVKCTTLSRFMLHLSPPFPPLLFLIHTQVPLCAFVIPGCIGVLGFRLSRSNMLRLYRLLIRVPSLSLGF